jgi:hypothetical protein
MEKKSTKECRHPASFFIASHWMLQYCSTLGTVGFMTVGIAIVISSVLVLWGLRARALPGS